jgi:hypothetical protein
MPCSSALLRGDSGEHRPTLFYVLAAAMRAGGLLSVMLCDMQNLGEGSFAGVADELIVGHTYLPMISLDSRPLPGGASTLRN